MLDETQLIHKIHLVCVYQKCVCKKIAVTTRYAEAQAPLPFSIPPTLKVNHTTHRGLTSQEFHTEQEHEGLIRMDDTGAKGLVN